MAIAQMPARRRSGSGEKSAVKFIEGATPAVRSRKAGAGSEPARRVVMIRFSPELLSRIDRAARHRGISRSAWISFTVSKALDNEG
jgi:hypothetical protein